MLEPEEEEEKGSRLGLSAFQSADGSDRPTRLWTWARSCGTDMGVSLGFLPPAQPLQAARLSWVNIPADPLSCGEGDGQKRLGGS